jgi:hypothetical protein
MDGWMGGWVFTLFFAGGAWDLWRGATSWRVQLLAHKESINDQANHDRVVRKCDTPCAFFCSPCVTPLSLALC